MNDDRFSTDALWAVVSHSGNAARPQGAISRLIAGGALLLPERPAVRSHSTDHDATLGEFQLAYVDDAGAPLYVVPFNAIFAEWLTIAEAKTRTRTFTDSVRLPVPKRPTRLSLRRREGQALVEVCSRVVDPADLEPAEEPLPRETRLLGEYSNDKVPASILFVAEGYANGEEEAFFESCAMLADHLRACEPYRSEAPHVELRAVFAASPESGISDAIGEATRHTLLGTGYGALGLDRYILPADDDAGLRRVLDGLPCDGLVIVCNAETYGGGGIFGRYAVLPGQASDLRYLLLHEFGHAFGALADEYYGAPVPYDTESTPVEPWEPNVTTLPDGHLKWADLADPQLPIPTPWNKAAYDAAAALPVDNPETRRQRREQQNALLAVEPHLGRVGAFEGAMYRSTGMYRPELQCLMFNHAKGGFCQVCRESIRRRLRPELTLRWNRHEDLR